MTMRKTILGLLIVLISLISCESQKEEDFRISLNYEHPRQEQYPEANFRSTKPVLPYKHHINVKDFIQKNLYDETTLDSDLKGTVEVPVDVELEVELFSLTHVGENTIPYNEEFRLFLTTKMPNPHYSPEVQVKISLVNFTVTQSGLEEQLLGA